MSREKTVSFRASAELIDALDALAASKNRSRSFVIGEALANYLELHAYQQSVIETGLAQMKEGRTMPHQVALTRMRGLGKF
jgi:predicted transcriptional regulator